MKKILIVTILIVIIIVLGIGGFFIWKNFNKNLPIEEPSGDIQTVNIGLAEKAVVTPVPIKEAASGANRIIDVRYPTIQSFKNKDFQKFVNDSITEVIFAYINEIKAIVDDETPTTALYTYKTSYEKFTYGDYLSLVITNDYQTGGIRSNKWKDIYNINVRSERIFYLNDIFPSNVDYEKEILKEINKQAKDNNYVLMNGVGLNELKEKQKFYIKDEKLIIYFDPSEIAPATYGELQFEMPFTLDENGKFNP